MHSRTLDRGTYARNEKNSSNKFLTRGGRKEGRFKQHVSTNLVKLFSFPLFGYLVNSGV